MLKENYELVDQKITEACKRAGRDRKDVTLIAVSKTKPLSDIEELLAETDAIDFGENKVQELVDKYEPDYPQDHQQTARSSSDLLSVYEENP